MANRALALVAAAFAIGLAPDPVVSPVAWGEEHLVVADGPHAGEKWAPELTPYLVEPLEMIAPSSPHTCVSVRKSGQIGFTNAAIVWLGTLIDTAPARGMVIFPTLSTVQDFNREKLTPTIEATKPLNAKVLGAKSRSARSSTLLSKRFPGGSVTLTGANSAADLRSKTTKYQFRDEIDEWPKDLDGQGDPYMMADARMIAFHATGDYKVFEGSTPTIRGQSRIDDRYAAGDQRVYEVPCPQCGTFQPLEFGGRDTRHGLKFNAAFPYDAHYVCRDNGCIIGHHEKAAMVRAGRWVATMPEPGRHPSYQISALYSLVTTWDKVAEAFLAAKDDAAALKGFVNLWLGESWEERGDAPDWTRLHARRGDYRRGALPPGALVVTTAVDVQKDGIYFETVGWGADRQSWSIDAGFAACDTADRRALHTALDGVFDQGVADGGGRIIRADRFGIDAGYQTQNVYEWVRRRPNAVALKGTPGWYKPAIASTPSVQDVTVDGRRVKRGVRLWPVGTWPLKSTFYGDLRKEGVAEGAATNPPGYCHFSVHVHDEAYFRQITAEHLADRETRGRTVREWVAAGANHYHDCRIYNLALTEHMGMQRWSADRWRGLAAERMPAMEATLFEPGDMPAAPRKPKERKTARRSGGFIERNPDFM